MRSIAILASILFPALMATPAMAQYVELGAAARHQLLVQVQTTPGAAEAARGFIAEEQRVALAPRPASPGARPAR